MLHGTKAAKDSELTAKKTFQEKSIGKNLPIIKIKKNELVNGINIFDLILRSKLANSKLNADLVRPGFLSVKLKSYSVC